MPGNLRRLRNGIFGGVAAIMTLLVFQVMGAQFARVASLPLPGPLAGMLLLVLALLAWGRVPKPLERASAGLLRHMVLVLIPSVAGVIAYARPLANAWLPFVVACVFGAAVTLAVTGLSFQWMLRRHVGRGP